MSTITPGSLLPQAGDGQIELLRKIAASQAQALDQAPPPSATPTQVAFETDAKVKIWDGTHSARVDPEGNLQVVNVPFDFEIAETNQYVERPALIFSVFGWREGFTSTSILQDIASFLPNQAGGAAPRLTDMTGSENLEIVSSNAADDGSPAGTGVQTVHVTYLDLSDNIVMSPDIVLNGVTPVALAFKAKFIYWTEASAVGSNTTAVGNIDVRNAAGGVIFSRIEANGNRSAKCAFRVPAGYRGFIQRWAASARGGADQKVFIRTQSHLLDGEPSGGPFLFRDVNIVSNATNFNREAPYWVIPALTDVKISTQSTATAGTNRVDASFQIILIADEVA